jgi:DNA helicase HerA-like ATPase
VLEEAHTVVPEASTMGLGDFESKGLVAKIAQIALQGRKYGVGLLVIAQRTATVSKTVLTQCNTIVTFTCIDSTSLEFLGNVLGKQHTQLIPNLPFLHAVVFGKGVRSERPIVIQIPYSDNKKNAPRA